MGFLSWSLARASRNYTIFSAVEDLEVKTKNIYEKYQQPARISPE